MALAPLVLIPPQQPANPLDTRVFETTDAGLLDTPYLITAGQSFGGSLFSSQDTDYIGVVLEAGRGYEMTLSLDGNPLSASLTLLDASGENTASSDAQTPAGDIVFRYYADQAGTYFLSPDFFGQTDYILTVTEIGFRTWSHDAIADYLIDQYWRDQGEPVAAWSVADIAGLRIDLSALDAQSQAIARLAMQTWSDYSNVRFVETATNAQITLSEDDIGGFALLTSQGGQLTEVEVNVGRNLTQRDPDLGGDAYTTYLHELGHALGLGHGGDYNSAAQYHLDALYANDTLLTSVMSYFDLRERPFQDDLTIKPLTPMPADIVAIQRLYGAVTANSGDTLYGAGGNAQGTLGLYLHNLASDGPHSPATRPTPALFTILDTDGIDTLDLSWSDGTSLTDLRPGAVSYASGQQIAFVIAEGTIIENLCGHSGDDAVIGNTANNWITGAGGNDTLIGLGGDDALQGGTGDDSLRGEEGNDTLDGGTGADTLLAGPGDNAVFAGAGADFAVAGNGRDTIWASTGDDTVWAGAGDDLVGGGAGQDNLSSGRGNDTVWASTGDDTVYAGDGNDELAGGSGQDDLWAGAGDDLVFASAGHDALSGADGDDTLWAGTGNDEAFGADGDDLIDGGGGNDTLWGGAGEDTLSAGAGTDILFGLSGDDILSGGGDDDHLTGGDGADVFVFTAGQDIVTDFNSIEGDRIDLRSWGTDWISLQTAGSLQAQGADTRLVLSDDAALTLAGLAPDVLQDSDFLFA